MENSFVQMEIPSFKSSFGSLNWHVPILLRVVGKEKIRSIQKVNEELVDAFLNFLRNAGRRAKIVDRSKLLYEGDTFEGRKAHRRYLISQIYSLAIPSCLNLGLISQQETEEMLTFFGRKLLKMLDESRSTLVDENEEAMNLLRKIVMYEDQKHWKILEVLSTKNKGLYSEEIVEELQKQGVKITVSRRAIEWHMRRTFLLEQEKKGVLKTWRDREHLLSQLESSITEQVERKVLNAKVNKVNSLLSILRTLCLIEKKQARFNLNCQLFLQIKERKFWLDTTDISTHCFFKTLEENYRKVRTGLRYVPIPLLRDLVCLELNFPWDVFDEKLSTIGYEYLQYKIALIPPITSKVWGIFKGKKNLYYISIDRGDV